MSHQGCAIDRFILLNWRSLGDEFGDALDKAASKCQGPDCQDRLARTIELKAPECPACGERRPTVEVTDHVRMCRRCLSTTKAVQV